ncbi:MAG: hypothetical protein WA738_13320 [Candidatus Angelobacter sp.]
MAISAVISLTVALVLEVWLAALLLRRKIHRVFPIFCAYIVYSVLASTTQLWAISDYRTYYFVYWGNEAIGVVLSILALWEVFRWVFALFWLRSWFRWVFYGSIALGLALATSNAILNPPAHMHPLSALIFSAGITVRFMQATIFALFWLLAKTLEIGFRRYAFGITLGFGASSMGTLTAWITRSVFGTRFDMLASYLPPVAYIFALGFWLHVFWRKEPPEAEWAVPITPEELAEQIRQYTKILKKH